MSFTKLSFWILLFYLFSNIPATAQTRQVIDTAVSSSNWAYPNAPAISDDGSFVGYIESEGIGAKSTLVLQPRNGEWVKRKSNVQRFEFVSNNKHVIYLQLTDTLNILDLVSHANRSIIGVSSFQQFKRSGKNWLLYTQKDRTLILSSVDGSSTRAFPSVIRYELNDDFSKLLLLTDDSTGNLLKYIDLKSLKIYHIAHHKKIENLIIDKLINRIAFKGDSNYYLSSISTTPSTSKLVPETNAETFEVDHFSVDQNIIFVRILNNITKRIVPSKGLLWTSNDPFININGKEVKTSNFGFIDLSTHSITIVEGEDETAYILSSKNEDFLKIVHIVGDPAEQHWNPKGHSSYYIYDICKRLKISCKDEPLAISPNGKYVILADSTNRVFKCYTTLSGNVSDLTSQTGAFKDYAEKDSFDDPSWTIFGWVGSNALLMLDHYDFWLFDLSRGNARCVTNGYGRRNDISFRIANPIDGDIYSMKEIGLLSAFNNYNKENGFYKLSPSGKDPKLLRMDSHYYSFPASTHLPSFTPVKSKRANYYIVAQQRVDSAMNYFITSDFISLQRLTNIYPEQKYNWLTSELINYPLRSGKMNQAILYKPQDFDSNKKYPVIFNYYEKRTDQLHLYQEPGLTIGKINIPWFVSRGYIVCVPDIPYIKAEPGYAALLAVESAADFLGKLDYIDSVHMALNGHSFGGYETNYISTHSKRFAAAVSACGFTDIVSAVGTIAGVGHAFASGWAENAHIGYHLWENPAAYIKNSPIFSVDKLVTPILLMANKNDGVVNYTQGIEFFMACRRLQKPAWLIQYDDGHSLTIRANAIDYTYKVQSFLDYYLKSMKMPEWMDYTN
jgi:hypothetical protein